MEEALANLKVVLSNCHLDEQSTQPCYTAEDWAASKFRLTLFRNGASQIPQQQSLTMQESVKLSTGNKIVLPGSMLALLTKNGEARFIFPCLCVVFNFVWMLQSSVSASFRAEN